MSTSRRTFLKTSAAAAGALGLEALPKIAGAEPAPESGGSPLYQRAEKPLSILILGGTGFTGPEQVNYALARGHKVTLLNRNQTRPDFFKGKVEQLIGDLNSDVSALEGKKFDVVIDNPTTSPRWVRNVGEYMKGNTGHYIFISTLSAYASDKNAWADESDPTAPLPAGLDAYAPAKPDAMGRVAPYGPLKAESEREVMRLYPDRYTIIRPGLIVGPLDRTDRFTYWPYRIDKGGEVLAPGNGNDPVQIIDVRDLAEWMIRVAENHTLGVYNATGPSKPMTMAEMLYGIRAVTTAGAQFTWVPWSFLSEQKVRGWSNMPVVVEDRANNPAFSRRNISKAIAAGLTFRPLAETAKDTLDWIKTRPAAEQEALAQGKLAGMSPERETEVLRLWKEKQGAAQKP
jgi:2'-hydroxyisoflavone reductase